MLKKYSERIGSLLKFWSHGLIGPAITSLVYQFLLNSIPSSRSMGDVVGLSFMVGVIVWFVVWLRDDEYGKDSNAFSVFYGYWVALTITVWNLLPTISFSKTTLLISAIVFGARFIYWALEFVSRKLAERQARRVEANESAKKAERDALVERINGLIGDSSQTTALLTAIERLTQYVPEVSERLLSAVADDAERFVMLRGLESTTTNDILRQKCKDEADEIASTARKLCADSTEMALELLAEYQGIEAEGTLGDGRGSRLTEAHEEFKRYLAGLREIRPYTDDGVSRELRELAPQPATRPLRAQDEIRELRAKN